MGREQKQAQAQQIAELAESYKVVGVLNMHKLPARQLQQIRERLRTKAIIKMAKKSLIKRALADRQELHGRLDGNKLEPALLFSNENPFKLYKLLKESRTTASAKPGDIAAKDIVIIQGLTSLPPGPAVSSLQKVGLKASVQGGKIAIMHDKVVCKVGETVGEELASVLSLLKMEPMEIGLDLMVAYEEGVFYGKDVLDIDQAKYISNLQAGAQHAINLSLNAGYITKFTAALALRKAFMEAKSLAIESNVLEKDFIDDVLAKAIRMAKALQGKIGVIVPAEASGHNAKDNK